MHAVIMAGGKGMRFWPRSREKKPKHLLDITGEKTLIQQTVERIQPLFDWKNILVVTGKKHAREVARQLPKLSAKNIIIEPEGKNTAACIGLAALHILKKSGDDIMAVLPADHAIVNAEEYRRVLSAAIRAAAKPDALVTIGIRPESPHTGYGYIEQGNARETISGKEIFSVCSIREKPDAAQAQAFVQSGKFYWNSGMFIWKTSSILKQIEKFLPDLHAGLMKIQKDLKTAHAAKTLAAVYKTLPSVSIDYGVMEKANNVFVIPASFGWSDAGSWDTIYELMPKDAQGNAVAAGGEAIFEDAENCLVYSPKKMVAVVGVRDLIVVDTKDALLICEKGSSQDVKKIVEKLEAAKKKKYL
ncbi:MAG TPA: mannose-1-phosphate guanylyltransferase [Smithellaceae bacterium]|nr:mannose-1-phosphate guanylyltransferase [Smithellaceae bacterium]HRS88832.1 mannose-1-phosphate guanylyltransferase [Smithellaceae bacterium]HRV25732.1 mannose-1-phosphate guanylyltransferase [Smithellaceae bacterium]